MSSTSVRPPAVAGLFYEADGERLSATVDTLLGNAGDERGPLPSALIAPHAGYRYSGATAAQAYALLQPLRDTIRRVVLLGPAHRVYLEAMAVPSVDAFSTPLGNIPLDREAVDALASLPGVQVSDEAHREEHSLEVQLPFLQRSLADFSLVPIVVGHCSTDQVAAAIDFLWGGPETLVVVSTDLSHFHDYQQARRLDTLTCERILARETNLAGEDACGATAVNGLLCSTHGAAAVIDLLAMCNSGDTAGDRSRVVGYGAFALH